MPVIPLISFTDTNSGRTWTVTFDTVPRTISAVADVDTTDFVTTEADLGGPAGTVLYHYCDNFDHIKLKSDTIFPFAVLDIEQNSVACGYLGTTGSLTTISNTSDSRIRSMAFEVGPFVPVGTKYYLEVYSHQVSYTAVSGDTAAIVTLALIDLINATTAGQWDDHDSAPNIGTPGFKPLASEVGGNPRRLKVTLNSGNQFAAGVSGGTQDSFDFSIDVITTDETISAAHDGTATVNATGTIGLSYLYSLDGSNYVPTNIFTDLYPGVYTAYVKGTLGTQSTVKTENFIILGSGALNPDLIDFPWQEKICYYFELTRDEGGPVVYDVREPIKWDAVNIMAKRDKDWHGWSYQYSDGVIELEFDCPAGMEVLLDEYEEDGNDGELDFTYGYIYQGTQVVLFPGKINFNVYKKYPQKITASVERKDFNNLFQSRFDTKVSMTGNQTIDGVAITPPAIIDFSLHSKEIVRNYSYQNQPNMAPQVVGAFTGGGNKYIQFATDDPQQNEIEESFTYPIGISSLAPYTEEKYNWSIKFAGTYNFRISFTMEFLLHAFSAIATNYSFKAYFRINDTETLLGAELTGHLGQNGSANVQFTRSVDFLNKVLAVGDKVYLYIVAAGVVQQVIINQKSLNLVVDSLESTGASAGKGWFLFDAVDHIVKTITNNQSYLKSNFLSLKGAQQPGDGPGSLFITTNGKQIRQFQTADSPLKLSAKDALNSAKAIWCLGLGFEKSGLREVIRVERVNYFYQNKEILVIEECYDYKEEVAKDLIYNEVEIGYMKYQAEGYNTLDEFNTKHELITPIKTNKLKLTQLSSMITSGYAIETSRRQQYANSSKDSVENDDEAFLIAMRRVDAVNFVTERNEAFDQVNNLISPQTAYNLRVSPERMLFNWAIWLKNAFFFKASTEKIKTTLVVQNGLLETQLKSTDVAAVGDINKDLIKENQDTDLINYPVEESLFKPEWISWKCRLTADKVEMINRALRGQHSPAKNYGYVVVKDYKGEYQGVWLYELSYNFYTEKAEFKGLKTANSPVTPGATCCKNLAANGCFVLINGKKTHINAY